MNPGPDCPRTPAQVYRCLGCSPQCGRCVRTIRAIMDAALPALAGAGCSDCPSACQMKHDEQAQDAHAMELAG
jgi:bacterioferritin-associated ferredoxin